MRKFWIGLVLTVLAAVLLVLLRPSLGLADDAVPEAVQAMIDDYYGVSVPVEYLSLPLADGDEAGIAVVEGLSVMGFVRQNGEWAYTLMTSVPDELRPARLEQLPGEAAFALMKEDGTARMTYRFDGENFRLTGWAFPDYRPVQVKGDVLIYGEGDNAFETFLPGGVTDWPFRIEDLPLTPDTAMALAAITEQNVAEIFPGYTLRGYVAYNDGFMAEASYSRIDNGELQIRRAFFGAGHDVQFVDCLPVPLSGSLLSRLESAPFDSLISCWETSTTFLTQDAFSREALELPEGAVLLENVVQEKSVVALVEEQGMRFLYVWEREGSGWNARRTLPLPEDAYLDLFHAGSGVIQFEWAEQNMSASFARQADGQWLLSWCTAYGPSADIHFSANAFGISWFDADASERMQVGTLADRDLFAIRLGDLDGSVPELDRSGWAVVNNPDPADRLHLRAKADQSARSQGKFYNGTPVQVLGKSGSWTKVRIGFGDTARTGWMMTKYLVFGEDMDRVEDAFPDLFFRDEYEWENRFVGGYMVVGVEEGGSTKQYILLGLDGGVMYVPQSWLWGGNG